MFRRSITKRFLGAAGWMIVGTSIGHAITLLTTITTARFLGAEVYGQFILLTGTLSTVGVFAGFGIGTTATKYVAELRNKDHQRLERILTLSTRLVILTAIVITLLIITCAEYVAKTLLNSKDLTVPFRIAALTVLFSAIDGYKKSILVGLEAARTFAKCTVAGAVLASPILLTAAYLGGITGAASALAISTALQAAVSYAIAQRALLKAGIKESANECWKEWKVLRNFAIPALLSAALVAPAHWVAQALLAHSEQALSELAVLGVAMQWFNIILFLPGVAGRALLPILAESSSSARTDERAFLRIAIASNVAVVAPISISIAVGSQWILSLYGEGFVHGSMTLSIASLTTIIVVAALPLGQLLAAKGRMWTGTSMNLAWALIYVALSYFFIGYGATGVICSLAAAYIGHATWTLFYIQRLLESDKVEGAVCVS